MERCTHAIARVQNRRTRPYARQFLWVGFDACCLIAWQPRRSDIYYVFQLQALAENWNGGFLVTADLIWFFTHQRVQETTRSNSLSAYNQEGRPTHEHRCPRALNCQ